MKYIVDKDALIECLDCVDSISVNGERYIQKHLLKEFLLRFPKDTLAADPVDNTSDSIPEVFQAPGK
jgi:hypothetical protein